MSLELVQAAVNERLRFTTIETRPSSKSLEAVVRDGLLSCPKHLPSYLFYDERGSELFEEITELDEYYPTRTERAILHAKLPEILSAVGPANFLIEFGSGSSVKTRLVIDQLLARQAGLKYLPMDISGDFLRSSANQLLAEFPQLEVWAFAAEYFDGLRNLPARSGQSLFLFLGSNLGNFEPAEAIAFLSGVGEAMMPGDSFLVGLDLVKSPELLHSAYNDSLGVTAAFNKNLLHHLNSKYDGDFQLDKFEHRANWVPANSKMEMNLISLVEQDVHLKKLNLSVHFNTGEAMHTENSHKYTLKNIKSLAEKSGLQLADYWVDDNAWYTLALFKHAAKRGN